MVEQAKETVELQEARKAVLALVKSYGDTQNRCGKMAKMFEEMKEEEDALKQKMTYLALSSLFGHLQILYMSTQKSMEFFVLISESLRVLYEENDVDALKKEIESLRSNALSVLQDIKGSMDKAKIQEQKQNEEMHWFG